MRTKLCFARSLALTNARERASHLYGFSPGVRACTFRGARVRKRRVAVVAHVRPLPRVLTNVYNERARVRKRRWALVVRIRPLPIVHARA